MLAEVHCSTMGAFRRHQQGHISTRVNKGCMKSLNISLPLAHVRGHEGTDMVMGPPIGITYPLCFLISSRQGTSMTVGRSWCSPLPPACAEAPQDLVHILVSVYPNVASRNKTLSLPLNYGCYILLSHQT